VPPDLLRGDGRLEVCAPTQSVRNRVDHRRHWGDGAGLAGSPHLQVSPAGRRFEDLPIDRGQVGRARQLVVQERDADRLRRVQIVAERLVERLADPLRNAAMDLPVRDLRLQERAEVVERAVIGHLDLAGFAVDRDRAGVATDGICEADPDLGVAGEALG
jgi:hypothetical protein